MKTDKILKVLGCSGLALSLLSWGHMSAMLKERTDADLVVYGRGIGSLRYFKMVIEDSIDNLKDYLKH